MKEKVMHGKPNAGNPLFAAVLGSAVALAVALAASPCAAAESAGRWTVERAKAWAQGRPWYCGFNHVPANAANDVEIWMKDTFSPELIRSEFKLATDLGFNCVRIFLQYKVYEDDPGWFLCAFEKYLELAHEAKLEVMPVFFDDCTFSPRRDPHLGRQDDPMPGWGMWGWVPSPGYTMVVDSRTHWKLERYVKDVISRHKDDRRIFAWDLYNEPTFKIEEYADYSLELVRKSFRWAREVAPSQPLTVGTWNGNKKLEDLVHAESDIITFHCYGPADATRRKIAADSRMGRPVICTEWMMRNTGCTIQDVLGVYKETGVGCMLWGLVNGRTQTHVPNAKINLDYKGPWVTDIFRPDHTPYDAREIELIKKATGRAP